jgi:hypothetical protein
MRDRIGTTNVSDGKLGEYFDAELDDADLRAMQEALEGDPALRMELEQLGIVRGVVVASLQRRAAEVPQARFEQVWDAIERGIAREEAPKSEPVPSFGRRLWTALSRMRWPVLAAAGATAVTLWAVDIGGPSSPTEGPDRVVNQAPPSTSAKNPETPPAPEPSLRAPAVAPDMIAQNPSVAPSPAPLPVPEGAEVEIHDIQFGGNGRISQTGTVTVLYVEEEPAPAGSERSL